MGTSAWSPRFASGFGDRFDGHHEGIDIAAPLGTPILATASGHVEWAAWDPDATEKNPRLGNLIKIRHTDNTFTLYAHLSQILVQFRSSVAQGQVIGAMGSTGNSTGSHVHFEYHPRGGDAVNPDLVMTRGDLCSSRRR